MLEARAFEAPTPEVIEFQCLVVETTMQIFVRVVDRKRPTVTLLKTVANEEMLRDLVIRVLSE